VPDAAIEPVARPLAAVRGRSRLVLTAPQQVAAAVRHEIVEGALKPGDKLPSEEELARLFCVSRPTVRAALQELCAAKVLVVRRGRNGGYHVGALSLASLEGTVTDFISLSLVVDALKPEEFFEVRAAHELLCAETAARRRTAAGLTRLQEIADTAVSPELDPREAFELDLGFHRVLAEEGGNPLTTSFEGAMIAVLRRLVDDGRVNVPAAALESVAEIVDAVRAQDPEAARAAMWRHLEQSKAHYSVAR
jgi:GntR family transcriptional regulator, transcriptional repressor for pyruvate dehydrogenase complex